MRAFCWLSAVVFLALPRVAESASMRCGQTIISDGDSRFVVLSRCGEPAMKEARTVVVREKLDPRNERLVEKLIEEWTYNFGPYRLIQIVVLENGTVVDVKSGGYGY